MEGRYDDVAEYISRQARLSMVELCLDVLNKQIQEELEKKPRGGRSLGATTVLADRLGVSKRVVNFWLKDKYQAKNINAKLLLAFSLKLDPAGTRDILIRDLERHQQELSYLINLEPEKGES